MNDDRDKLIDTIEKLLDMAALGGVRGMDQYHFVIEARRIARKRNEQRNREIADLHHRLSSEAGLNLAMQIDSVFRSVACEYLGIDPDEFIPQNYAGRLLRRTYQHRPGIEELCIDGVPLVRLGPVDSVLENGVIHFTRKVERVYGKENS